jgi:hypothetical protein
MLESIPTYCDLGGTEEADFFNSSQCPRKISPAQVLFIFYHPSHHSCLQHVTVVSCSMSKYVILLRVCTTFQNIYFAYL